MLRNEIIILSHVYFHSLLLKRKPKDFHGVNHREWLYFLVYFFVVANCLCFVNNEIDYTFDVTELVDVSLVNRGLERIFLMLDISKFRRLLFHFKVALFAFHCSKNETAKIIIIDY